MCKGLAGQLNVHEGKTKCLLTVKARETVEYVTEEEPVHEGAQRAPRGTFNTRRELSAQSLEEARSKTGS